MYLQYKTSFLRRFLLWMIIASISSLSNVKAQGKDIKTLRKLYQVPGNTSFDINKLPPHSRALYTAFLNSWGSQSFSPDFRNGLFSDGYKDKINLYGIRGSKNYMNYIKAFLEEGIQDPKLVNIIYNLIEPVLSRFETSNALWPPGFPLPGATDSENIVTDKWSSDYNKIYNPKNNDQRSAARRRRAWAGANVTHESWGMKPTEQERKSPRYKTDTTPQGIKRILYLSERNDFTSIGSYGTPYHPLDLQLGIQHLFWAGYILDVNRNINPRYGKAADIIWDYKINHFELNAPLILGARHPVYKFYSKPSTLHHANDAHASLFHVNVVWHEFREKVARPDDVTALKYLVQTILDDIYLVPVPEQAPQSEKYKNAKIANYCHWNNATNKLLNMEKKFLPGDITYDRERAGTLLSLMHGKVQGTSGNTISDELLEGLSNMHALIVEQPKAGSGTWRLPNEITGYNKSGSEQSTKVLFNNGKEGTGFYYGGNIEPDMVLPEAHRATGGFYLSWDRTGRQLRMFTQRSKNPDNKIEKFDLGAVLKDPDQETKKAWEWLSSYLLFTLRRPEVNLQYLQNN